MLLSNLYINRSLVFFFFYNTHVLQIALQANELLFYNQDLLFILKQNKDKNHPNNKPKEQNTITTKNLLSTLISTNFRFWLVFLYVFTES